MVDVDGAVVVVGILGIAEEKEEASVEEVQTLVVDENEVRVDLQSC